MINLALLALRKHNRNKVVFEAHGMKRRVTPEVMGLLIAYQYHRQKMTQNFFKAVYYRTQINNRQKEIKALVEKALNGLATAEDVMMAEQLQAEAETLSSLLTAAAE